MLCSINTWNVGALGITITAPVAALKEISWHCYDSTEVLTVILKVHFKALFVPVMFE